MPRSQLTEQYQRVMSLVEQLHALAEDERNFILDLLVPLPEQPEVKKAAKRASGNSSLRCKAELLDGSTCHMVKTHSIHAADNREPDAHKFLPKKSSKSALKSPRGQSLSNAIQRTPKTKVDDDEEVRCTYQYPKDSPINAGQSCNMEQSFAVHDFSMGYAGYHEFQSAPVAHEVGAGG